jgi:hypothetical protein
MELLAGEMRHHPDLATAAGALRLNDLVALEGLDEAN